MYTNLPMNIITIFGVVVDRRLKVERVEKPYDRSRMEEKHHRPQDK